MQRPGKRSRNTANRPHAAAPAPRAPPACTRQACGRCAQTCRPPRLQLPLVSSRAVGPDRPQTESEWAFNQNVDNEKSEFFFLPVQKCDGLMAHKSCVAILRYHELHLLESLLHKRLQTIAKHTDLQSLDWFPCWKSLQNFVREKKRNPDSPLSTF